MSEFENAWATDEDFWEFVGDNRKLVGIAISNGQGLDILNALKDIYTTIDKEPESAMRVCLHY